MNLAVIPARVGSKRIPRKNIREFCGKPMIAWPIEIAKKSGLFDHILVSTDDEEIAEVARSYGAEVPFKRPAYLSDDYTGTNPVVGHAIEWYQQKELNPEFTCCIYATAPFVRPIDLQKGFEAICKTKCDYVFSAARYSYPIQRAIRITKAGRVKMFQPKYYNKRSQDLEQAYHDAGQFYWGRTSAWLNRKFPFAKDSVPMLIPEYRVQDIDTPEDWKFAELKFELLLQMKKNK